MNKHTIWRLGATVALGLIVLLVTMGAGLGSKTIKSAQVTLSTSAALVVNASGTRRSVLIRNHDASISIYIGGAGVTSTTGVLLKAGDPITVETTAAVYAVAASGTPVVGYLVENE